MSRWAIYQGEEFEDFYGEVCEVQDDNTHPNFPCYQIRFLVQPNEWIGNIDDDDIRFFTPNENHLKQYQS